MYPHSSVFYRVMTFGIVTPGKYILLMYSDVESTTKAARCGLSWFLGTILRSCSGSISPVHFVHELIGRFGYYIYPQMLRCYWLTASAISVIVIQG